MNTNHNRNLLPLGSQQKNERFKRQPKQSAAPNQPQLDNTRDGSSNQQQHSQLVSIGKHQQPNKGQLGGNISAIQQAANNILDGHNRISLQSSSSTKQLIAPRLSDLKKKGVGSDFHSPKTEPDEYVHASETEEYKQELKKGNNNILVGVRCRPLSKSEKSKQAQVSVKILDEKVVIIQDVSAAKPEEAFRLARSKEKHYAFDYAFDETCDQSYVFEKSTKFLIDGIMQGYNASVFAYGSTGAGKTYTMLGSEDNPGIMLNSIEELFRSIDKYSSERDYKLKISYVEVYNENIKDLLVHGSSEYLDLREDNEKGVCVAGVTEIMTTNTDEIRTCIRQGNRQRTKERTDANEASSRSHAVLQITVEHKDKAHGINAEINMAKLSLIDLAGSERASNTNNRGIRMVEGANINKSLLSLGNCINALCEQTKTSKSLYIPYRDSKLTRLLKDSLGGNCRTVMIANISPSFTAYEDTLNTLKYADRAKQIKTIVKRNVLNVEFHISNYAHIINQLREEILGLRNQLQYGGRPSDFTLPSVVDNRGGDVGGQVKLELKLMFAKETEVKKDIYELDMQNEDLAFKLFSKRLDITKAKSKGVGVHLIEQEAQDLQDTIEKNYKVKAGYNDQLQRLELAREKFVETYQSKEKQEHDSTAMDALYNQHLLQLKEIDIMRKENRADFHIKQRDSYISHLKQQLSIRDRIIKEKLGLSLSNFMPSSKGDGGMRNEYQNNLQLQQISRGGSRGTPMEIASMHDIDRMSRDLVLPGLNMTKSSAFNSAVGSGAQTQPHKKASGRQKLDFDAYKSQEDQVTTNNRVLSSQFSTSALQAKQLRNNSSSGPHHQNSGPVQLQQMAIQKNLVKRQNSHSRLSNGEEYSMDFEAENNQNSKAIDEISDRSDLVQKNKAALEKLNKQLVRQTESHSVNVSFQSQQQNNSQSKRAASNKRNTVITPIGNNIQSLLTHNHPSSIPPLNVSQVKHSPGEDTHKSFASELSIQKQQFLKMQKQIIQSPNDVFSTHNTRPIPKDPHSVNRIQLSKKLNEGQQILQRKGSDPDQTGNVNSVGSRRRSHLESLIDPDQVQTNRHLINLGKSPKEQS